MLKSKKIAIVSFLTVFLFGLFCGITADRLLLCKIKHKRPKGGDSHLVQKFSTELNLTPSQKEELIRLLKNVRDKHAQIRNSNQPKYESIRIEFQQEFAKILNSDQQLLFEKSNQRFDAKREKKEKR